MTIFSIIQAQAMRRKKPGKRQKEEDPLPPEDPVNRDETGGTKQ